jgi:hypothetical protein
MTYRYDARIATLLNRSAGESIFTIAQDLVTRLELSRQSDKMENVPIIFVAHSLVGLVVKDVHYPFLYVVSQLLMTNHRLSNLRLSYATTLLPQSVAVTNEGIDILSDYDVVAKALGNLSPALAQAVSYMAAA